MEEELNQIRKDCNRLPLINHFQKIPTTLSDKNCFSEEDIPVVIDCKDPKCFYCCKIKRQIIKRVIIPGDDYLDKTDY